MRTSSMGSRAQTSFVRHGADKAEIEGLFFYQDSPEIATQLEALGFENTGELILRIWKFLPTADHRVGLMVS